MLGLVESIVCIIVGFILYFIGKKVPIEDLVNRILWIIGAILIIVGVGFLIYNIVMLYVLFLAPICGSIGVPMPSHAMSYSHYWCHSA